MKKIEHIGRAASETINSICHYHNLWELVYYVKGQGSLNHGDTSTPFIQGDIAVIPNGITHHTITTTEQENYHILFQYSSLKSDDVHFFHDSDGYINRIITMMYTQFYSSSIYAMNLCETMLELIEQFLISFATNQECHKYCSTVSSFINELRSQFSTPSFQVNDVIRDIPYSSDYFRKLFTKETGKSPAKYLNDLRLNNAKRLLRTSDYSIKTIAYMSGFSDQYYFSRQFKNCTGKSPKEWQLTIYEEPESELLLQIEKMNYSTQKNYADFTVYTG